MSKATPYIITLAAGVTFFFTIFSSNNLPQLLRMGSEIDEVNRRIEYSRSRIIDLEREIGEIQVNDIALERAAREELGMSKEGEVIYVFQKNSNDEPQ